MNRSFRACVATVSLLAFAACNNVGDVFSGGEQAADSAESDSVLPPTDNLDDLLDLPPDELPPDVPQCPAPVDFEIDGNGGALVPGQTVTGLPALGISAVLCTNNDPTHPNTCVIFDSANPSGGDVDLGTPNQTFGGPGVGLGGETGQTGANDSAENNVLIIAENVHDCELNGLVDDPDDEAAGGTIEIDFAEVSTVNSITILDIDANEPATVEVLLDGGGSVSLPLAQLGDNSKQTLSIGIAGAVGIKVHLPASGAIAALDFCPDPPDNGGPDCVVDADCGDVDLVECNASGECIDKPATFSGLAFWDSDNNGTLDVTDTTLAGVVVTLYEDLNLDGIPDGAGVSTTTGMGGTYSFGEVNPVKTYVIGCAPFAGFDWTTPNVGNDDFDSDIDPTTGYTSTIATFPGEEKGNLYCGYKLL